MHLMVPIHDAALDDIPSLYYLSCVSAGYNLLYFGPMRKILWILVRLCLKPAKSGLEKLVALCLERAARKHMCFIELYGMIAINCSSISKNVL